MDASQPAQARLLLLHAVLHQVVQVAEAPGDEAQARDAEQGVEDLRVGLEPLLRGAVDVAARGVAHGRRAADEDQEEHAAPRDHVEPVHRDQEAQGREHEPAKRPERDLGRFPGAVLGRELVAVGVGHARVVRDVLRRRRHRLLDHGGPLEAVDTAGRPVVRGEGPHFVAVAEAVAVAVAVAVAIVRPGLCIDGGQFRGCLGRPSRGRTGRRATETPLRVAVPSLSRRRPSIAGVIPRLDVVGRWKRGRHLPRGMREAQRRAGLGENPHQIGRHGLRRN